MNRFLNQFIVRGSCCLLRDTAGTIVLMLDQVEIPLVVFALTIAIMPSSSDLINVVALGGSKAIYMLSTFKT